MTKQNTREQKVQEFHKAMGLDVGQELSIPLMNLRLALMREELEEVEEAMDDLFYEGQTQAGWEHLLKELCDLQYVLSGTVVSLKGLSGVDFDAAFNRVHNSNMSKLDNDGKPVYNDFGKVLKGPNYKPADMRGLIND